MRSTASSAAVLVLLAAGVLLAQPPMRRGHNNRTWAERKTEFLSNRLSLSDSQKQQVLTLYKAADQNSESLENKLFQARRALREATRRNAPDTEIDQLSSTVGFLVGQIEAIQAKSDTAVYNSLTAEQRQKMDRGYFGARGGSSAPARLPAQR
jgi:Spy/CpxP family protein refolding chaperone